MFKDVNIGGTQFMTCVKCKFGYSGALVDNHELRCN